MPQNLPERPDFFARHRAPAFVTGRFATLQSRRPATAEEHPEESADA
jgi:hypothetical protein